MKQSLENNYPAPPKIQKSHDYEKFKFLEWNRNLRRNTIEKLAEENRENFQMQKFPILVDVNYRIIDGQHRFTTCRENGWPVYYIQEVTSGKFSDVTSVNRAGSRHSLKEMIQMGARAGKKGCVDAVAIYEEMNGFFDLGAITRVLMGAGSNSGHATQAARAGKGFEPKNKTEVTKTLLALKNSNLPERNQLKIIFAVMEIVKKTSVTERQLIARLEKNASRWKKMATTKDCIEMMLDIYNHSLTEANRIYLSKWVK